ncbi:dUTP diphosphatase [Ligilactobacillus apodemi]|uniref:dUTP diphosphatase n=1 Tax=Ligilactobacillus apodemi DSM 16634 = JCM 16172 TaxID=1423724 RepID=A0A0R1U1Q6_9LACO|nr:dUTP diphosphatase [Ligilactobacillus apodemi]KRL85354.1 deoxyuridine 5-triphosphate nucleotidohydrolase [Ligilactobacillus apodemi DSM 16634 = JCM 16172]MCR1902191.1 dUTP diphosphatase [Ligilactobacillus apodemi]
MKRGFKIVSKYENEGLTLPVRATQNAAGYDFCAAKDFVLPSIWKRDFLKILRTLRKQKQYTQEDLTAANKVLKPYLVPTGIKAYMQPEEFLMLANRSSNPLKHGLILPNGVGIVDADYYDNENNEGEIFFQLVNFGLTDKVIKKGERLGQGIFLPYLLADDEKTPLSTRTGGFGSSGR